MQSKSNVQEFIIGNVVHELLLKEGLLLQIVSLKTYYIVFIVIFCKKVNYKLLILFEILNLNYCLSLISTADLLHLVKFNAYNMFAFKIV